MRFLLILLCSPLFVFSQKGNFNSKLKKDGASVILRTDILPILNTVLEKKTFQLGLSSEFCFNTCYTMLINVNMENSGDGEYRLKVMEPGTEIRGYLEMNEQAFLHLGLYSFLEFSKIKIDRWIYEREYLDYNRYYFKSGVSGGFRVLLSQKAELDIASYLGYAKRYAMSLKRHENLYPTEKTDQIDLRILLSLGYRL